MYFVCNNVTCHIHSLLYAMSTLIISYCNLYSLRLHVCLTSAYKEV